jgi:GYF domain 2
MRSFKLAAETAVAGADRWYVSDGATAIGPVALDLITRGIQEGRVPPESYVRHEAWRVWRPVCEITEVNIPPSIDSAAPTPPYHHPESERFASTDDVTLPGRPLLPEEIAPADALEGAADLSDALHLLLNAAVLHLRADVALLHRTHDYGAIVHFAHGPYSRAMIGLETSFGDPVMAVARTGNVIVAEPSPGPAGKALVERLIRVGLGAQSAADDQISRIHHVGGQNEAAVMHPILTSGRLIAVLEFGRKGPQLRACELVILENLIDTFVARTEAGWWH